MGLASFNRMRRQNEEKKKIELEDAKSKNEKRSSKKAVDK